MCEMVWTEETRLCNGKIDWHHVWSTYGTEGQINEVWAILGVCQKHHRMVDEDPKVRDALRRRSLELATEKDLIKYPRGNWEQMKKSLNINL